MIPIYSWTKTALTMDFFHLDFFNDDFSKNLVDFFFLKFVMVTTEH